MYLLVILAIGVPLIIIMVVSSISVHSRTVLNGTSETRIRWHKLWEFHIGVLGLVLSLSLSWCCTICLKNLFGKPRPDLLSRCDPDWTNFEKYLVKDVQLHSMTGQMVSADICRQTDKYKIDDGFRSYPSGHSSIAAAGLIYTLLFIVARMSVINPPFVPSAGSATIIVFGVTPAAFPSRVLTVLTTDIPSRLRARTPGGKVQSMRHRPTISSIYILAFGLMLFGLSVFISGSRWHDRRHHGFDIVVGYCIGIVASILAFRYYHLPIE